MVDSKFTFAAWPLCVGGLLMPAYIDSSDLSELSHWYYVITGGRQSALC